MVEIETKLKPELETKGVVYTDHNKFFDVLYDLKLKYLFHYSECQFTTDKKQVFELFKSINSIYEWTSNYIEELEERQKKEDNDKIKNKLDNIHTSISKIDKETKFSDILEEIRDINLSMNNLFSKLKFMPKEEIESDTEAVNFWKSEPNHTIREIKKAMSDYLGGDF